VCGKPPLRGEFGGAANKKVLHEEDFLNLMKLKTYFFFLAAFFFGAAFFFAAFFFVAMLFRI